MEVSMFDTKKWPSYCPDKYWALQDDIKHFAALVSKPNAPIAAYKLKLQDLPPGLTCLHSFQALRNITVVQRDFAKQIVSVALQVNSTIVEQKLNFDDEYTFQMFSKDHMYPLHCGATMYVLLKFAPEPCGASVLPAFCLRGQGLCMTLLRPEKPSFLSANECTLITFDGSQVHILVKEPLDSLDIYKCPGDDDDTLTLSKFLQQDIFCNPLKAEDDALSAIETLEDLQKQLELL